MASCRFASAASFTWDGGDSTLNNWTAPNNWNPNGAPANNGTADIHLAGSTRTSPNVDVAFNINSLVFDAGASSFTLGGSTLTIQGGGITNNSSFGQSINNAIVLGAAQTWTSPFDLAFNGNINNNGNLLTIGGGGTTFAGVVSGSGGLTFQVGHVITFMNGASANTFTGTVTVNDGQLTLNKTAGVTAIASNTIIVGDGIGTDRLVEDQANEISDSCNLTFNSSGHYDLGADETVNSITINNGLVIHISPSILTLSSLNMTGGTVSSAGAGSKLVLNGNLTTNASPNSAQISGSNSYSVDLGGAQRTFTVGDDATQANDLDISAVIANGSIIKAGSGTLRLSATNTFAGGLTLSAGTLAVGNDSAAGTGTLTLNGGTILSDAAAHVLSNAVALTADSGVGGSQNLTFSGTTSVSGARTLTVSNTGSTTFSGAMTGTASDSLTKGGSGTLVLSGTTANTFGALTVSAGQVTLNKTAGINAFGGALTINGGTVQLAASNQIPDSSTASVAASGATLDLNGNSEAIGALSVTGGSVTIGAGTFTVTGATMTGGAISSSGAGKLVLNGNLTTSASANSATISNNLDLGAAVRTFNVANGAATNDLDISAVISNGGIDKETGTGTLRLSGANIFSGGVTLGAGTLAIGNGAALGSGAFTINGGTILADGAPQSINNAITVGGDFAVGGSNDLTLNSTMTLTGSRTVTVDNTGLTTFSRAIGESGGSQSLTKNGTGTLIFSGGNTNTYSGTTTVNAGTLRLSKSSGSAIAGPLVIGDGLGGANADVVQLTTGNFSASPPAVTINSSGLFDVNGQIVSLGTLTMTGGSITTGTGSVTLTSNVTTNASASAATISGNVNLGVATRTFTVADNATQPNDLDISATITNGGIIKAGLGTLRLSAANTLANAVTLNAGGLAIGNNSALGTNTFTINGGTILADGGARALTNTIAASGDFGVSGSNDLTLSGNMTLNANRTVTVDNTGTTTFSGVIGQSGGTQGFTKAGAGTLVFAGAAANTYTGVTTVNGGTLQLSKTTGSALNGALVIGDGIGTDTVQLTTPNAFSGAFPITINSSGVFDANGQTLTLNGAITMTGGTFNASSGVVTITQDVSTNASSATAIITGNLNTGGTRMFTVADGSAATDVDLSATIVNSATLIKEGPGAMALSGAGANLPANTIVNAGTLLLNKTAGVDAVAGNLTIGDDLGGANADVVRYLANSQITANANTSVTVNSSGLLDLNGFSDFIRDLVLKSGNVTTGVGTLGIFGNLTSQAGAAASSISGNLDLGGNNTTFDVADGAAAIDLDISAVISDGGIIKNNSGTLRLSGANIFSSGLQLNNGTLLLGNNSAVGSGTLTLAGGVLQADGVSRVLANAVSVTGSSSVAGALDLTLNGLVTINPSGNLIKNGAGTLFLTNGANVISGGLTLNTGTLTLSVPQTIGAGGFYAQNGGTENGNLTNNGTFTGSGGIFNGALQNNNNAAFNGNFTINGGLTSINNVSVNSTPTNIVTLTLNGPGLTSSGTVTLNNGILAGNGPLTNNGLITGNGTIDGSGGLVNNSVINLVGGNLLLTDSGTNTNTGTINGAAGLALQIDSALTNTGTLNLNGGTLRGSGTLNNAVGGTTGGFGTVSIATFNNSGGTLLAQGGTLRLNNAFANPGIIQVAAGATLNGAAVTNSGNVQGAGTIANQLTNASGGTIEPVGGTLTVTGVFANNAGATINAAAGNKLLVSSGLATNAGLIDLSGGTFDNGGNVLSNTGSITGFGTFRTGGGGLTNNGSILFAGGSTSVSGNFTNAATRTIEVRNTPAIFLNNVTNNGTFKTTNTTATFAGTFTNNGIFTSDPATQFFQDLTIGATGALQGGMGDVFAINGNLTNQSTQVSLFNISVAQLTFAGGATHQLTWSGIDRGAAASGFDNNFAIGIFELGPEAILQMLGGALYVHEFRLDGGVSELAGVTDSQNIYYDASDPANAYLNGSTYALQGGGQLAPVTAGAVPEPGTLALLTLGLLAGGVFGRRKGRA